MKSVGHRSSPGRTVLLVEPWFAGSHRAWAEGLAAHSRHSVEILARRPSGWRDTFDHAARRLAGEVTATPDVVLASSMMDLGAFLDASGLGEVPSIFYLHENQLTYDRARPDPARGAVTWASAQRADAVVFNSRFHRGDFHDALSLVGADGAAAARHRKASRVIPVGVDVDDLAGPEIRPAAPPTVVWNHRWEDDKDPTAFVEALEAASDLEFRLILLGAGADTSPLRAVLEDRFGDRILHCGHAPRPAYAKLLRQSDIVVSTARQEFFGVAVVEGLAAGAVPVVPDRLAYPEVLGAGLASCLYEEGGFAPALRRAITDGPRIDRLRPVARRAAGRFAWPAVVECYDALIDSMA